TTLDGTPPSVSITAPAAAAIVSGSVTVTATASDNVGVAGVQLQLDGAPLGSEDVLAPYTVAWNTTTASAGLHTLTAVARDAAGNRTTSAAVIVTVANSARQVSLAWDRNTEPNISGYKVYVGTTSGVYGVPLDVGNVTAYTVTGLAAGTAYYISVTAYDQTGLESGFSNEVTAIVP
ncbi:MAG TPA: Ig-like domain-containing protein, partial [Gemmatimonadaceae bacterium]|nr:Ig-like domain-containing protein [Gemmatimonadaceae bacterium]